MGHFMWLNLIKEGCVPLQAPGLDPQAPRPREPSLPQPSLPQGVACFLKEYLPGGPTRQAAWVPTSEPPAGNWAGRWVGPVRRRVGREIGQWGDLRCCHRRESREGLGAPEALEDRVDPAWGGQQALSVTFVARPWT